VTGSRLISASIPQVKPAEISAIEKGGSQLTRISDFNGTEEETLEAIKKRENGKTCSNQATACAK